MCGLVVRFALHPGAATAFDRLVGDTLPEIERSERGILLYLHHEVRSQRPDLLRAVRTARGYD
jgi:hypothetical protein